MGESKQKGQNRIAKFVRRDISPREIGPSFNKLPYLGTVNFKLKHNKCRI